MLIPGPKVISCLVHMIIQGGQKIMDLVSITSDQSNRLNQIIRLTEKRSSEIQPFDSQIHDILQVDESILNIFCTSDNQTFINNDTIKRFFQNIN